MKYIICPTFIGALATYAVSIPDLAGIRVIEALSLLGSYLLFHLVRLTTRANSSVAAR